MHSTTGLVNKSMDPLPSKVGDHNLDAFGGIVR